LGHIRIDSEGQGPTTFGDFELIRKLGAGGMAEVYLARSFGAEGLAKQLVIKRILPSHAQQPRFVSMFIDEAKIAVSLNHPNIVQVFEFGKVGNDYFLAMEYVDGVDLSHLLARLRQAKRPLPLGEAIYISTEICKGLDYVHRKNDPFGRPLNLVHRDINPQNIMVSQEGACKIVDFGIAKARNMSEADGLVRGKFSYMSPEQALGGDIDHRSDVFSVGLVFYELIFGQPLFNFETSEDTLSLIRKPILPPRDVLEASVPHTVVKILQKALDRVPDRRFESARAMQIALTRLLFEVGEIHDAQTLAQLMREAHVNDIEHEQSGDKTAITRPSEIPSTSAEFITTPTRDSHAFDFSALGEGSSSIHPTLDTRREKKAVVCLVCRVHGFASLRDAVSPARAATHRAELKRLVDGLAFRNDAILEDFSEYELVFLLGIPTATENDAERALWMALDLLEAIDSLNMITEVPLELSIGAALGGVLVSYPSESHRTDWELLGNIRALTTTLAEHAPPQHVYIGGHTTPACKYPTSCEGSILNVGG